MNRSLRIVYEDFYMRIIGEVNPYTDVIVLDELYMSLKKWKLTSGSFQFPLLGLIPLLATHMALTSSIVLKHSSNVHPFILITECIYVGDNNVEPRVFPISIVHPFKRLLYEV